VKHRVLNDPPVLEMLDDNSLENLRRDARIPDAFRIHDNDGTSSTNAEARCLAAFHPPWTEQQAFALKK
jgi:hypothetical protein